jgi:hypothetical protein
MTEKASKHTTEYLDYLKSKEWRAKRKQILDRDKCTCQICKWKPTKQHLHVHHLHYKNLFNENLDDLILLCEDCHGKVHKLNIGKFNPKDPVSFAGVISLVLNGVPTRTEKVKKLSKKEKRKKAAAFEAPFHEIYQEQKANYNKINNIAPKKKKRGKKAESRERRKKEKYPPLQKRQVSPEAFILDRPETIIRLEASNGNIYKRRK